MNLVDDLKKSLDERRRANILRFLARNNNYMASADDVRLYLNTLGTAINRHVLIADLAMLSNLGLLILMAEGTAARLTSDGLDVAEGSATMPGVARPLPE